MRCKRSYWKTMNEVCTNYLILHSSRIRKKKKMPFEIELGLFRDLYTSPSHIKNP